MSNNAMSNETDLDWLARNVHVWREGANYVCVNHTDGGYVFHEHNRNCAIWFTKVQWLAHRAELQNKPSWKDAPKWATHIAQNGRGQWWFMLEGKLCDDGRLYFSSIKGTPEITKGELLGDWRDTLEKRPEEFKQFTSIEDNQEQVMTKQKDMKQDNKWFERGELPPVGVECDIRHSCLNSERYEKVTVAAITNEYLIVKYATFEQHYMLKDISFRPIRTERDVLLSIIVEEMNRYDTDGKLADAILAAGFSLRDK